MHVNHIGSKRNRLDLDINSAPFNFRTFPPRRLPAVIAAQPLPAALLVFLCAFCVFATAASIRPGIFLRSSHEPSLCSIFNRPGKNLKRSARPHHY